MRMTRPNLLLGLVTLSLIFGLSLLLYEDFDYLDLLLKERRIEKETLFDEVQKMRVDPVRKLVMDYSFWEDMVKYIDAPDAKWARENIDTSFATYSHNDLWIYRKDGKLVHAVHRHGETLQQGAPFPIPFERMNSLFAGGKEAPHVFLMTPQGVEEILAARIYSPKDGAHTGPWYGLLVASVLLDEKYIAELSRLTRSKVRLVAPGEISTQNAPLDSTQGVISFSRVLKDAYGTPVRELKVTMDAPDIRRLVRETRTNALIGTVLLALLSALAGFVLLSRQRLKTVNVNLDSAQRTAQMGSWQWEPESDASYWSDNLYRVFGLAKEGTVPSMRIFYGLVHPEDLPRVREVIEGSACRKSPFETECRMVRPDGEVRVVNCKGEAIVQDCSRPRIVGNIQDITERSRIDNELALLNRQKDEIISKLGHDLNTPLTPLLSLLPMVTRELTDPRLKRVAEICYLSAEQIKGVTDKTLKLARLSSSGATEPMQSVVLAPAVNGYLSQAAGPADRKQLVLENAIEAGILVLGAPDQLEELFANVISNAIRFSPEKGAIRIAAERGAERVTVTVHDEGVGLSPEQRERIFEEFFKADQSRHELAAVGLGLSICKRIVRNHNCSIWAESPGQGMGTTIFFTLPSSAAALCAPVRSAMGGKGEG
jgi:PAS domain S-box-containing protein